MKMRPFKVQHPEGMRGKEFEKLVISFTLEYFPRSEAHVLSDDTMLIKAPEEEYSETFSVFSNFFLTFPAEKPEPSHIEEVRASAYRRGVEDTIKFFEQAMRDTVELNPQQYAELSLNICKGIEDRFKTFIKEEL